MRDADRMHEVNSTGTEVALTAAAQAGLSPIVRVSSCVPLLPSAVLTSTSPTGRPEGPYSRSKADSERIAFRLRDAGAPVVVTNPGGVYGPHDPRWGESARIIRDRLVGRTPMRVPGALPVVDVRDLGTAHARLVGSGADRSRCLMAGRSITGAEFDAILHEVTGRRLPAVPVPGSLLPPAGRLGDALQRRGLDPGFSSTGVYALLQEPAVDDGDVQEALDVRWRPVEDTLADMVAWLHTSGRITARQAGRAVARAHAVT